MKTFKGYLNEVSVHKPAGVGTTAHNKSVEDSQINAANIEDPETLKKVNAFVQAVADGEFLSPQTRNLWIKRKTNENWFIFRR